MISSARSQSAETQWPLSGRLVQKRALTGAGAQPVQIQVSHLLNNNANNLHYYEHDDYDDDDHDDDNDDDLRSVTRSSDPP